MSKSQNTKNEQQKDLCITNEQLTEQWKKGELPSGWYYIRLIRGEYRIDLYINGKNEWIDCPDNIIDTVVCEVPSYEEWQALKASYEMSNDANLKQATWMVGMEKETAQLKELLKECSIANTALVGIMDWLRKSVIPEQRGNCEKLFEKTQELQKQLDEALQ